MLTSCSDLMKILLKQVQLSIHFTNKSENQKFSLVLDIGFIDIHLKKKSHKSCLRKLFLYLTMSCIVILVKQIFLKSVWHHIVCRTTPNTADCMSHRHGVTTGRVSIVSHNRLAHRSMSNHRDKMFKFM